MSVASAGNAWLMRAALLRDNMVVSNLVQRSLSFGLADMSLPFYQLDIVRQRVSYKVKAMGRARVGVLSRLG